MTRDWVRYETIEIDKNGYYVKYEPIFTGQNLAVLAVSFYDEIAVPKAIKTLEAEFNYWVNKYPTPLMVLPSNKTGAALNIKSVTGNEYILGYPGTNNIVMKWKAVPDEEYSNFVYSKESLANIYKGLNFKTSEDAKKVIAKKIKDNKKLIIIMLLWFSVIPALIAIFGWANPYVSTLALIYSLWIAFKKGGEITGHIKPSAAERKKMEEEQEKEHHHYHCKQNPDGFLRLKLENFTKDEDEELGSKIEKLRS